MDLTNPVVIHAHQVTVTYTVQIGTVVSKWIFQLHKAIELL